MRCGNYRGKEIIDITKVESRQKERRTRKEELLRQQGASKAEEETTETAGGLNPEELSHTQK